MVFVDKSVACFVLCAFCYNFGEARKMERERVGGTVGYVLSVSCVSSARSGESDIGTEGVFLASF